MLQSNTSRYVPTKVEIADTKCGSWTRDLMFCYFHFADLSTQLSRHAVHGLVMDPGADCNPHQSVLRVRSFNHFILLFYF